MAYELFILDSAKREYREIIEYLFNVLKSAQAAINFIDEFDRQVLLIKENPEIFALSRVPELAVKNYRVALVNNYLVLYKCKGNMVIIAHIFHQSQDYARLV